MKKLNRSMAISLIAVSRAMAAGSPKVTSDVSRELNYYSMGVGLMLDKRFDKAEKWFRKGMS